MSEQHGPEARCLWRQTSLAPSLRANPEEFAKASAKVWYKLTHRDMGPVSRLLGPEVAEAQIWQDPVPVVDHELVDEKDMTRIKRVLLEKSGPSISELVSTAWASASTFRGTDKRGGASGARIRLTPQKDWQVNNPGELAKVLQTLEKIQKAFNSSQSGGKRISLADLIVLGGCVAVKEAAKRPEPREDRGSGLSTATREK